MTLWLALYAALLPVGSGISVPIGLPPPFDTLSTLLGIAATAAVVAELLIGRRRALRLLPSIPVWLLFAALLCAGSAWSIDPSVTRHDVAVLLSLVALFVVVGLVRLDPRDVARIELAAVAGACAAGVYGLHLLTSGRLATTPDGVARLATAGGGEGGDPNITAATLLLPLLLALAHALRATTVGARLLAIGATALILAGVVLTGSRGGMLGATAGAIVVLSQERSRLSLAKSAAALVVLGAVVFQLAPGDLHSRLTEGTSTGRTSIWLVGLRSCPKYCAHGSGWGTFANVYRDTRLTNSDLAGHGSKDYKAHNVWLAMVVEGGVPAVVLALAGIGLLVNGVGHLPRSARGAPLAALAALVVSNLFLSNFSFKYFWFVLTYAAMVTLAYDTNPRTPAGGRSHELSEAPAGDRSPAPAGPPGSSRRTGAPLG